MNHNLISSDVFLSLVTTLRGQPYTQVFMYLIYKDFNKCAHLSSFVINQSVIEVPQDLCVKLTAPRGNAVGTLCVTAIKLSRVGVQSFSFGRDCSR